MKTLVVIKAARVRGLRRIRARSSTNDRVVAIVFWSRSDEKKTPDYNDASDDADDDDGHDEDEDVGAADSVGEDDDDDDEDDDKSYIENPIL